MGKWRALFEANLPPVAEREYGEQYEFGPPATEEQLAIAEQALGVRLPADVREMLAEFNGVWYSTAGGRELGHPPDIMYLDIRHMTADVPNYLADADNPLPPRYALRKVVFVAQSNGFGDLWGVCASDVAQHKSGTVVRMNHENGRLKAYQPNLTELVRAGLFGDCCESGMDPVTEDGPTSNLPGLNRRRAQPSFAHWEGTVPADLIAECEDAIVSLIDRLIALGLNPSEQQVRAEIDGCIRRFDDLQWSRGDPWIDTTEQEDICDVLHELIDLTGFEASEEWTDVRDW
jgi:hypothetical protein